MKTVGWLFLLSLGVGCSTVKPYEKEYLLSPLMNDEFLGQLRSDFTPTVFKQNERLATGTSGGGNATSCPTCGG